jgi:outer membrane biosynthesis protein TonB
VILLWWPMFFHTDSVMMWLCRGVAWTLCFELLLLALSPLEAELWATHRGERLSRRAQAATAKLHHESPRRRIGRFGVLAGLALALPLALIALGLGSHLPAQKPTAPNVTQVTRVVRVVKPVRVERVVKIRTVAKPAPVQTADPAPALPNKTAPTKRAPKSTPKHTAKTPAPKAHTPVKQTTPTTPTDTSGQQTDATQPATGKPGAGSSAPAA